MRNLTHPARPIDGNADDMALLRRYVDYGSQDAFAELVSRHLPWVYGTCRKALQDKHTAEDAAQAVFIILARRADSITPATRLSGWLFNTARFVVKDAKKQETRYRRRETVAREMAVVRMTPGKAPVDAQTQAALDAAMATLTERDRLALLMHFYEGLSLAEMATALGISKDGAKKRVARALTRLRGRLGRNPGAALTVTALALALRTTAASAAPIGLGDTILTAAILPGRSTMGAQLIAERAMSAAAGASHRLLKALLASELAVAVALVGVWTGPSLYRGLAPASLAARAPHQQPAPVGPGAVALAAPVLTPDAPPPAARPARGTFGGATDPHEAPYRSGAHDQGPDTTPLTPHDRPKLLAIGDAGPVAPTGGGGGPAGDGAPGSTYAGLEPVRRTAPTVMPAGLSVAERAAFAQATADALAARWGGGAARAGGGAPRGSADDAPPPSHRPVLPSDLVGVGVGPHNPTGDVVVPHTWGEFFDLFCPRAPRDAAEPDFLAGEPFDPAHPALPSDPERARRIARRLHRLFVEDGDGQPYLPWGVKASLGGMKPYAIADGDFTVIGGRPIPSKWLAFLEKYALASGGATCGDDRECPFTGPRLHGPADPTTPTGSASPLGPMDAQQAPEPSSLAAGFLAAVAGLIRRRRR